MCMCYGTGKREDFTLAFTLSNCLTPSITCFAHLKDCTRIVGKQTKMAH